MKIIFNTAVAGMNFSYRPKREYDLPDPVARAFIRAGQATEVAAARPVRRRGGKIAETAQRLADSFR